MFPERGLSLGFPRMTHKKFGKLNSLCTLELGWDYEVYQKKKTCCLDSLVQTHPVSIVGIAMLDSSRGKSLKYDSSSFVPKCFSHKGIRLKSKVKLELES